MDTIIEECLGSQSVRNDSKTNVNGHSNTNVRSSSKNTTPAPSSANAFSIPSIKINIPSNPTSTEKVDDTIELMCKPIKMKWDADHKGYGMSIDAYWNITNTPTTMPKQKSVAETQNERNVKFAGLIVLAARPECFEYLKNALNSIESIPSGYKVTARCAEWLDKFSDRFRATVDHDYVVSFDDITTVQKGLNEIMELLAVFQNPGVTIEFENVNASRINYILNAMANIQMGINAFTGIVRGQYIIDARYARSIHDAATLDKFVKMMIDEGFIPKVVGYNAYAAAGKELVGDETNPSERQPIWGQSRAVMYPDKGTEVIKVALSGWGIQSNKSEFNVSHTFSKLGFGYLLAQCIGTERNGAIVHMQRVDTTPKCSDPEINSVTDKIKQVIAKNNLGITITDDHSGNFGRVNNKPVFLDYAWVNRYNT